MNKRLRLLFQNVILCCAVALAQDAVLLRTDQLLNFSGDVAAEYRIEKRDPGGSTEITIATIFRRDEKGLFLALILSPSADKGKGYLKQGDNLWLYDPVGKTFTFTSAKERFQNSSMRNSDLGRSTLSKDYRIIGQRNEKLGSFDCEVFDLEALSDKVSFPRSRIWVSPEGLVRKAEDYSLSGQLMRTTAIPSYQKLGERWLPQSMVILDHLRSKRVGDRIEYERTSIQISKPTTRPQPDSLYTKEYLEKIAR